MKKKKTCSGLVWFYGVYRPFQQYFSFIGGEKVRIRRKKQLTYRKSLTNFITLDIVVHPILIEIQTHNNSGDRH
jgi:hypothetical protein